MDEKKEKDHRRRISGPGHRGCDMVGTLYAYKCEECGARFMTNVKPKECIEPTCQSKRFTETTFL